jgi:hypothetical protein
MRLSSLPFWVFVTSLLLGSLLLGFLRLVYHELMLPALLLVVTLVAWGRLQTSSLALPSDPVQFHWVSPVQLYSSWANSVQVWVNSVQLHWRWVSSVQFWVWVN